MNQVCQILMMSSVVLILLSDNALSVPYTYDRHHDTSGHNNHNGHVDQGYNNGQHQFGTPSGGNQQYQGQQPQYASSQQQQPGYGGQQQHTGPTGNHQQHYNQQPHGQERNHHGGYQTHGY